ncbi:alpha/beta hydrolase [Verrucomicrobiaceae bacterium R5-34]|nr:alpha/beta hydrolase [Verrucomicrobiaceae bacterium R5-34]
MSNPSHSTLKTQHSKFRRLGVLRLPMPWHQPRIRQAEGDTVILLHGLWRSMWAMDPMADFLHRQGYHTVNIPYPSFRKPLEEIISQVHEVIAAQENGRPVHFVTHSLGGIVTRQLLAELPPKQPGRIVMLAPPNQGSEIIDWLDHLPPLKMTLGPAGAKLGRTVLDAPILPQEIDSAVIMGQRSTIPLFRWLLDEDNDGIVSVKSGKIEGLNEFHVLDTDHTFIATEPQVMDMTSCFLKNGRTE